MTGMRLESFRANPVRVGLKEVVNNSWMNYSELP